MCILSVFTCSNGQECLTQILPHTNRIYVWDLKLPNSHNVWMYVIVWECESITFPAGSYAAGVGHGARPSVGKVRFDHARLSAIPLCLLLYLLQRQRSRRWWVERRWGGMVGDIDSNKARMRKDRRGELVPHIMTRSKKLYGLYGYDRLLLMNCVLTKTNVHDD